MAIVRKINNDTDKPEKPVEQPKVKKWDPSSVELTGIEAIDMVQMAIAKFRHGMMPVRVIYLKKNKYKRFYEAMQELHYKAHGKYIEEPAILTFDNVDIKEGSVLQFEEMKFEYFKDMRPRAEA